MPRQGRLSSTQRPIDSITDFSGILDRPPSRTMTVCVVIASAAKQSMLRRKNRMDCFAARAMTLIQFRVLATHEVCMNLSLQREGAGNAGCLLHPRDGAEKATDLGAKESGIFLRGRLDDPNRPEIAQQNAVCAQRYWEPFGRRSVPGDGEHAQAVVCQARCMYVRSSDDLLKAPPAALGLYPPASQFFLADHNRVAGVRCQS
jgi:hypothetical protein